MLRIGLVIDMISLVFVVVLNIFLYEIEIINLLLNVEIDRNYYVVY